MSFSIEWWSYRERLGDDIEQGTYSITIAEAESLRLDAKACLLAAAALYAAAPPGEDVAAELRAIDALLDRRPALAGLPRIDAIQKAINVAKMNDPNDRGKPVDSGPSDDTGGTTYGLTAKGHRLVADMMDAKAERRAARESKPKGADDACQSGDCNHLHGHDFAE